MMETMVLNACDAFDRGVSAPALVGVILDKMDPDHHVRTFEILRAGVAAFCRAYSRRFLEEALR